MGYDGSDNQHVKGTERPIRLLGIGHFPDRLNILVDEADSLRSYADKAGLSEGVVRKYLKGVSYPTLDRLEMLAKAGDANTEWLATGKGSMRLESRGVQGPPGIYSTEMEEFALIPGYSVEVAAGAGAFPDTEQASRKLAFRHKWLRYRGLNPESLVLVFAKGDSMEPTISDNNTLMLDTGQRELTDGSIYVIRTDGHLIVKRIQKLWNKGILLISDNKEYREQQIEPSEADDLEVIGRVVWIGKDV
ncbi:MAG: helix-turn-helix transcriptional regulator [Neptuniibacter sp.]